MIVKKQKWYKGKKKVQLKTRLQLYKGFPNILLSPIYQFHILFFVCFDNSHFHILQVLVLLMNMWLRIK